MSDLKNFRKKINHLLKEAFWRQDLNAFGNTEKEIGGKQDIDFVNKWGNYNPYSDLITAIRHDFGTDSFFYKNLETALSRPQLNKQEIENIVRKYDTQNHYLHFLNLNENDLNENDIIPEKLIIKFYERIFNLLSQGQNIQDASIQRELNRLIELNGSIPKEIQDLLDAPDDSHTFRPRISLPDDSHTFRPRKSLTEDENNKWSLGFKNTKTFDVSDMYSHGWKTFLQGCRTCNKITKLNNMYEERQYVGNVYQSLCNCDECGNYVVFDEHKFQTYKTYMKQKGNDITINEELTENSERNKEIASTIINQLGGFGKLKAMTGAYNFVALDNGVSFKIKNRSANFIKIILNGKDLYDVEIGRISGANYKIVKQQNDVYFDELKKFIENATGMYLSLFENKLSIKRLIENQISNEEEYKNKLNQLKSEGKITLSIGNHGLIFMQIRDSSDFMKSYNSYKDAYNHYIKNTAMMAEGEYGFDDFDEGPQPGDAEYHNPGPSKKQIGIGKFTNIDWPIFHETLIANEEAMANGGRLPDNPNYYPANASDLTDSDEGLLTREELQHLSDFDIVEINGTNPVILSPEYKKFTIFLKKAHEIWNMPAPRQDNSPSTLRYRDDGGTDGG